MTATSFTEFRKLYTKIPREIQDNIPFIAVRCGAKIPEKGVSLLYRKNWLKYYEVKNRLTRGQNIAVVARVNGLLFLDVDIENTIDFSEINTFTVRTPSGGKHYYFYNEGKYPNQRLMLDDIEMGELRANDWYVTCVGSWANYVKHEVHYEGTYTVINDVPIAKFEGDFTKYFKKGEIHNSPEPERNAPETLYGKIGKPVSIMPEKYKQILRSKGYEL